jgi:monoamine oxidase
MSDYDAVYTTEGLINGDPGRVLRNRANQVLDCLNNTGPAIKAGTTRREQLLMCGWEPKTPVEWAVDWAMSGEDSNGEPASILGAGGPDPTYVWWGPNDRFVTDQNPRGFAHLIDAMVRSTVPPGDVRIQFGAFVTHIEYSCSGVTVTTKDGRMFKAKQVISTLPVGVLQQKHASLFSPPVPPKFVEALLDDGLMMDNLTHVVAQFPYVWWDDRLAKWLSANKALEGAADNATTSTAKSDPSVVHPSWREQLGVGLEAESGEFCVWHNLNHESLLPGSNTLLSFLGDPQSSLYEGMSDAAVTDILMKRLRSQHPDRTIPEPTAFFMSRHGYDPLSYGAYSGYRANWKDKYMDILRTPLVAEGCPGGTSGPRVRWAGEGVCDNFNGYTHGGLYSGRDVAANLLYDMGKGPKPSITFCDA